MKDNNSPAPWKRLFARLFDYSFFYLVVTTALYCTPFFLEDFLEIGIAALLILVPILFIPFEALLIKLFSTTPGKKLFGIKITDQNGKKLTFITSLKRSISVWIKGFGCGIPILNIFCFFRFRKILKSKGSASWDQKLQIQATSKRISKVRAISIAALFSLLFGTIATKQNLYEMSFTSPTSIITQLKQGKFLLNATIKWVKFESPEGTFDINFPKKPTTETKELPIPNSKETLPYTEHCCTPDEETLYSISYTTLPNSWLKWSSGLVLKGSLKVLTKNIGGTKIKSKKSAKFKKHPALHYTLIKGTQETAGMLILVNATLYKIDVSYTPEKKQEVMEHLNAFLESFQPK